MCSDRFVYPPVRSLQICTYVKITFQVGATETPETVQEKDIRPTQQTKQIQFRVL